MLCIWFPWAPRVLTLTEVKRRRALHCTLLLDISLGRSIGERKEGNGKKGTERRGRGRNAEEGEGNEINHSPMLQNWGLLWKSYVSNVRTFTNTKRTDLLVNVGTFRDVTFYTTDPSIFLCVWPFLNSHRFRITCTMLYPPRRANEGTALCKTVNALNLQSQKI